MSVEVKVLCSPDSQTADRIRVLFCQESSRQPDKERNPLMRTNFNALLDSIAQRAFDKGRRFQRGNPDLE